MKVGIDIPQIGGTVACFYDPDDHALSVCFDSKGDPVAQEHGVEEQSAIVLTVDGLSDETIAAISTFLADATTRRAHLTENP